MKLHFLEASVPLTKTYEQRQGVIVKTPYPHVYEVTSHDEDVRDLRGFEAALKHHAKLNHCLLKGALHRTLKSESRAGSTDANDATEWICLDIDGLPETTDVDGKTAEVTVDDVLFLLGLTDVSYVVQWSASYGIENKSLRAHVFMLLDKPVPATQLKQWLMGLNFTTEFLRDNMSLTKTGNSLHWPLDVSACQNDKLIYIAPPVLKTGVKDPLKNTPRIHLVRKTNERLKIDKIPLAAKNRDAMARRIDELRDAEGLPKKKQVFKMHGSIEVLAKPDACTLTDIKQERGFVYLNLNGGDSWGYYHPENNPEFIYNFKGEPTYLTKELLPEYWSQLQQQSTHVDSDGILKLAFVDPASDRYYRGTYDQKTDHLALETTKSSKTLLDFAKSNGIVLPDNIIPEWRLVFDPHDAVRVDVDNRVINTFSLTPYMRQEAKAITQIPKTIKKVIHHVCGSDDESFDYYINWLAYVLQERDRPLTAWVFHGVPGTGKGTLVAKILRPLFGTEHTKVIRMKDLDEKYNKFMDKSLMVVVEEVETSALANERGAMADLRLYITDEVVPLRDMYATPRDVRNYTAWQFHSNASAPVRVTKDDRRFNVAKYQPVKLEMTDRERDSIERELQGFHDYLMTYTVDREKVFKVLENADREKLVDLTESSIDSVVDALAKGNMEFFIDQLPTDERYLGNMSAANRVNDYKAIVKSLLERTEMRGGECKIARDELRVLFDYCVGKIPDTPNKFTSLLKHHRLVVGKVWLDGKSVNGIKVNWVDLKNWPTYKRHFEPAPKAQMQRVK
jgi:hypothetical protein